MTGRLVWLACTASGMGAVAMLLVALWFLPVTIWEAFVPVAVLLGILLVFGFGMAGLLLGLGMTKPLRSLLQTVESGGESREALSHLAHRAPPEVAPIFLALARARARLQDTMLQLERDRRQAAALIEHMADGLLLLDSNELVDLANPAARRLLRRQHLVGRRLVEATMDAEFVELVRSAPPGSAVYKVVEFVGSPRLWVQVVVQRLQASQETIVLLQDVTELRRAEAARRDFVSNVSHELRTPIAGLKALVETLESGAAEDPIEGPRFLNRMHIEVDRLAHMANELLELARIESGRVALERHSCVPADLLSDALERLQPYAGRVGITLRLSASSTLSDHPLVRVNADARRVGQVFANLLNNALKFTPEGGTIEAGARELDDSEVLFWVSDTGVGIARESLPRVFERFYKIDVSRTGDGTGLGLAICKHLVLAHGGRIWADSDGEGRGTTFQFTLPRDPFGSGMGLTEPLDYGVRHELVRNQQQHRPGQEAFL